MRPTMTTISSSPTRRSLLAGSAATGAVSLLPIHFVAARAQSKQGGSPFGTTKADAILPFRVNVRGEDLANLRRRLASTRWPTKELVEDRSQGVQLATLRALARYWSTEYDWRKCEARLNALPQFMTKIDGVEIHFLHVRSPHENALPLINDARLAWLGHRAPRYRRSPDRPDQVRWHPRRCVPSGAAVLAWLRLLGRADRAWLGRRAHRSRVGKADGPPWLHALR